MAIAVRTQAAGGMLQVPVQGVDIGLVLGDAGIGAQFAEFGLHLGDLGVGIVEVFAEGQPLLCKLSSQPGRDIHMDAAVLHHEGADQFALFVQAGNVDEVVQLPFHHLLDTGQKLGRTDLTLGAGEQAFAQETALAEHAVEIQASPLRRLDTLGQQLQMLQFGLQMFQVRLDEIEPGAPGAQAMKRLVGEMDRIAFEGGSLLPHRRQIVRVLCRKRAKPLDEIAQPAFVDPFEHRRIGFEFHQPGARQYLRGMHGLVTGGVGFKPAGLAWAKTHRGFGSAMQRKPGLYQCGG
jgi:hypothetical protein